MPLAEVLEPEEAQASSLGVVDPIRVVVPVPVVTGSDGLVDVCAREARTNMEREVIARHHLDEGVVIAARRIEPREGDRHEHRP